MDEIIQFPADRIQNWKKLSVEKIDAELKSFQGDRYAQAVKNHVASTLKHFCGQSDKFAEVVCKTKRTLSDCCAEIMAGCGQSISDIDVYRGAVRNYFPNADIEFQMNIKINGDMPSESELERVPKKKKVEVPLEDKKPTAAVATASNAKEKPKEKAQVKAETPKAPVQRQEQPKKKPKEKPENHDEFIQLSLF